MLNSTSAHVCAQAKHLTQEQFAMNHPAGRIGRRLILRVGDCMLSGPSIPVAHPGDSIMGCLDELTSKACGCVLVTGPQQQLLGTFTDGDLRRTLQAQGPGLFAMKVGAVSPLIGPFVRLGSGLVLCPPALQLQLSKDRSSILEDCSHVTVMAFVSQNSTPGLKIFFRSYQTKSLLPSSSAAHIQPG